MKYAHWLLLGLTGCATTSKDLYVAWNHPCTGPDVRYVRVVDTQAPTLACIREAPHMAILTLMGMPPMACATTVEGMTTVFMAVSAGAGQVAATVLSLLPPESQIVHEVEHAFSERHGHCVGDPARSAQVGETG